MRNEIWRPVLDYEGLYEVSSFGRVRSFDKHVKNGSPIGRTISSRVLRTPLNGQGRRTVVLYKNGTKKSRNVYKIVAEAFLGACPSGMIVRHKNGDCTDDMSCNLIYGTHKENTHDRIAHGAMFYGENVHNAKLTASHVAEIRDIHKFRCPVHGTMALASFYGVSPSTISAVLHKKNWKHQAIDYESTK